MFKVGDIIVPKKEYINRIHVRKAKLVRVSQYEDVFDFELLESIYPIEKTNKIYRGIATSYYEVAHKRKKEFDV